MHKIRELITKINDKILLRKVHSIMRPLIDHMRSYWPAEETSDNFDYYMLEALLEVFGVHDDEKSNHEIINTAKKYLQAFNTTGSSNTSRMAVKFLFFTVRNLRYAKQISIHTHKIPFVFYHIRNMQELNKIHEYIDNNASTSSLAAKFICPFTEKPIMTPGVLKYNVSHQLMHPHYEYSLYEMSALNDLILFKATDINPINNQYIGSANLLLDIKEIRDVYANDVEELKSHALKK